MTSVADELFEFIEDLNAQFAVEAIRELNSENPFRTGLSRSNWTIGFDAGTVIVFPIDSQSNVVNNARFLAQSGNLLRTFFIKNNIEYIVPLAEGSSPQASRGWVDRSIVQAANISYGVV